MPVLLQQLLSTQDVDNNKSVYYVYISNDKGQTVSKGAVYLANHDRGLGIRVKKSPGEEVGSYWSDDEFNINREKVKEDLGKVEKLLQENKVVVIIKSELDELIEERFLEICPRSYKYLRNSLAKCIRIYSP
jgi:hypothetical protein